MRRLMQISSLLLIMLLLVGCMTPQDQAKLDELAKKTLALKKEINDAINRIKDGSLTVGEGQIIVEALIAQFEAAQEEMKDLKGKYKWYEIVLGILVAIGGSLGSTRIIRGKSHKYLDKE